MSKLKLFSKAEEQPNVTPWRVNFVNADTLPDIKVVRTAFLVNYSCVALAAAALVYLIYQEGEIKQVKEDCAKIEGEILRLEPADIKIREKASLFASHANVVEEYVKFKNAGLDLFPIYAELGSLVSDGFVYESVLVDALAQVGKKTGAKITISGRRKWTSNQDFSRVEALYSTFVKLPYFNNLKGYRVNARKPQTVPDAQGKLINFTFELTLEPLN